MRLEDWPEIMFPEQLDELRKAALLFGTEVVMNMPAKIILSKIEVELGAAGDNILECVQPEIPSFAQFDPEWPMFQTAAQSPGCVDKGEASQFEPGGAQIINLMRRVSAQEMDGRIADEKNCIERIGGLIR